jgi:hypothetical protein
MNKIWSKTVNIILIQIFIIYVPSQQLQDHLQTQHSVDTSNYFTEKHKKNGKLRGF